MKSDKHCPTCSSHTSLLRCALLADAAWPGELEKKLWYMKDSNVRGKLKNAIPSRHM